MQPLFATLKERQDWVIECVYYKKLVYADVTCYDLQTAYCPENPLLREPSPRVAKMRV